MASPVALQGQGGFHDENRMATFSLASPNKSPLSSDYDDRTRIMDKAVFHEGKACDAVIKVIEARENHQRSNVRFPEAELHAAPVEVVCHIGDVLYAFEHTGIEPFAGQIRGGKNYCRFVEPLQAALDHNLIPEDSVELMMPHGAIDKLSARDYARVAAILIEWVRVTAPNLERADIGRRIIPILNIHLEGVPFPVSLHRSRAMGGMRNRFYVSSYLGTDIEPAREQRVQTGYDKKIGKLNHWKDNGGARTVLILEENDIQLTNHHNVTEAVLAVEKQSNAIADEVYLVSTSVENTWWVTRIRSDAKTIYEVENWWERTWELDSASLVDITGR
jgi:hypothetical protein